MPTFTCGRHLLLTSSVSLDWSHCTKRCQNCAFCVTFKTWHNPLYLWSRLNYQPRFIMATHLPTSLNIYRFNDDWNIRYSLQCISTERFVHSMRFSFLRLFFFSYTIAANIGSPKVVQLFIHKCKRLNSLKHRVRSQITRLKLQKLFCDLEHVAPLWI